MIYIIYKIVAKDIIFRKIAIIPNGNKLMFQAIFMFSDLTLIEQITASSHPFCLGGNRFSRNFTRSFDWGTGAWVKKHGFNDFLAMRTPWIEKFFSHMLEHKIQRKFNKHAGEIKP